MTSYDIKNGTKEYTTTSTTSHSYFEILPDIFAYKLILNTTSTNPGIDDHESVFQGLTKKKGLTRLRRGLTPPNMTSLIQVSDEILAEIKRFGASALSARRYKGYDHCEKIYDFLVEGGSIDNIIDFNGSDHTFRRVDGSVLPTGIYFDYIEPRMHNLVYDLDKAVAILAARDDVTFTDPEHNNKRFGESIVNSIIDPKVSSIPYYNADGGRNAYISFFWTPNQEQATILTDKSQRASKKSQHFSKYHLIFDEDMLGLRAGGAAFFGDYYKEKKVERLDYDWDRPEDLY